MKKIFILVLVLGTVMNVAFAQNFTFQRVSSPIVIGDTSLIFPTVTKGVLKNISSGTLSFKLVREVNNLPFSDWSSQMCFGLCYGPEVDTIPPYPVPPISLGAGQSDTLFIDVTGRTPGTATIIMKAFVHNNPGNFIRDTFKVTLRIPSAIRQINEIVDGFKLNQNYPNPFNPVTIISFSIPKQEKVTLEVYNMLGERVGMLVDNQVLSAGNYSVDFNSNEFNISSGVYVYKLTAGNYFESKKMILIK